ncbi:DUF2442 domain-containing protein [Arundinibacter roseus]|uniref:DUF2442 domain-containing protein n=1 Tax=Arundinibacter roseus TaxID=2070510 RepID=A0A4R4KN18_9BACT|nr:DUF2442 domain-containing protein [Arundinibacter roseus]TDB67941.1 DUF2442 domain-containing protein [Arundinibacter roseus]
MKATDKTISVLRAEYLSGYVVRLYFDDDTVQDVDFTAPFARLKGYYSRFRELEEFKKFEIDNGTLVWGENWDVIFPVCNLYRNKFPI